MEMTDKSVPKCPFASEESQPTVNEISTKKYNSESIVSQRITIAGGFLDIALFVADVEHLKFIFDTGKDDIDYYDLLIGLIITSLVLQISVGILLFVIGFGKNNDQTKREAKWTKIVNHIIIGMVSIIAIIEIFVTKFGDRGESIIQFDKRHQCQLGRNATQF